MEIKTDEQINENGSYVRKTVKTTTPEEGFVPVEKMYSSGINHHGEYHKGHMKTVSYETNDPRITRPFTYGISALFVLIGVLVLIFGSGVAKFVAVCFIAMGVYTFISSKRKIDQVEEELKKGKK